MNADGERGNELLPLSPARRYARLPPALDRHWRPCSLLPLGGGSQGMASDYCPVIRAVLDIGLE